MNKELLDQLLPIAEKAKEGVFGAVEFLEQQAPEVINELLWWKGITSFLWWAAAVVFIVVYAVCAKRLWEWIDKQNDTDATMVGLILSAVTLIPAAISLFVNTAWLQILIAPRLYIIEYVGKLLK